MVRWCHETNWKLNISSSVNSITTKHGRLVTYGERNQTMESHDALTIWWCVVTWQIKSVTYLLWQGLWLWNLASGANRTHEVTCSSHHLVTWCHVTNYKWNIYSSRRSMATRIRRVLTYSETLMKSRNSDHVIKRGHESNWKLNMFSSIRLIPPDLTGWLSMVTGSQEWSHVALSLHSLVSSHEKYKT